MTAAIAFLYGLVFGSFLNVLLWRVPEGKGIGGRSQCRSCGATLSWYDLVPIISFIALRGRCRYCHVRIHPRYPLVELTCGVALTLLFTYGVPDMALPAALAVFGLLTLVSLFFFDLFYMILPDVLVLPAIVVYAVVALVARSWGSLATALLLASFFAILYAISRGKWLGFGDVKLAALIGLMFGWPFGFLVTVAGIWLGAGIAIILMAAGKATRKQAVPFGSFLTAAALIYLIFHHAFIPLATYFR